MADVKLKAVVEVVDQFSSGIAKFNKGLQDISATATKVGAGFTALAVAGAGAIYKLAQGAMEGEIAMAQLNHAVVSVSGGTLETVKAFEALATQIQKNGVLNKDAVMTGQAQLSTFGLSTDAVYALSQSMADLAVNQFGIKASGDQLTQTANMMQKALQGQFGVLEKSGIRFTEAQKEIILYGSEMEKVIAINEGFAQNLKFTNDVAMKTFAGQLENLKNKFGEAIAPLEDAMIPALQKLSAVVAVVVDWIGSLSPKTLELVGYVLLGVVAFSAITGTLLLLVGAIGYVSAGIAIIGTVMTAVLSPIGLIVIAIVALIATMTLLVVTIVKNWEEIKSVILAVGGEIVSFLDNMWNSIKMSISMVWTGIKLFLSTTWEMIKEIFNLAIEFIIQIWTTFSETINTIWITIWTAVYTFFVSIWESLKLVVQTGLDFISNIVATAKATIMDAFSGMWDGVTNVFTVSIDSLKGMVKSMINGIIAMVNKAIGGLNKMGEVASKIPGVNIPTIPSIPMLANGGIVTKPTLAMIGEGGESEAVVPLSKASQMGFGGGGTGINITINTNGYVDKRGFERLIDDVLITKLKRNIITA